MNVERTTMNKTKQRYLLRLLLLTVVAGIGGGWGYFALFPQHYFNGYPLIPAYFLVLGWVQMEIVGLFRKDTPQRLIQMYMLVRVIRMLASFLLMGVYCLIVRSEAVAFTLAFIVYYLIFLIFDSWFFYTFEGNKKLKKNTLK